jgi:ankyrin repeat protein
MKFLISIIIGFTLTNASSARAATLHATPLSPMPFKQRVQKRKTVVARDFYCSTKEERGSLCPESEAKVSETHACTPLMRAAENGRVEEVRALLATAVDVNARVGPGLTALMLAANEGHLEIVKALIAAGADANAMGATSHYGGFFAWMAALNHCNKNWLEIFDAMIPAGVELNPKSIHFSPLGYAISKQKDPEMIQALLKRGANVNMRDSETSETPLIFAAKYSSVDVVKALVGAGADVNARNDNGKTVLTIAENSSENGWQREIVLLLKKAGAKR